MQNPDSNQNEEGCEIEIKQDASQQTTSMELDIGNHPGRMVNLRYCLGDEILKLKRLATTHINRDEKIAFRFDPLPNKLCFLADCMFPVKPVIISVFYRT